MRTPALIALPALLCPVRAQEPLTVEAPIRKVRLHPDQAWITRIGSLRLEAGPQRVQLTGLPKGLTLEDVRISARGPAGTRLGEVALRQDLPVVEETPEGRRLLGEVAEVDQQLHLLELKEQNEHQATQLFQQLSEVQLRETRRRMATGGIRPPVLLDLSAAIEARSLELGRTAAALAQSREALEARKQAAEQELVQLRAKAQACPVRATAELDLPRSGTVELELTYRQKEAKWSPAYEARLSQDRSRLELVLLAAVQQTTEQAWAGVELELTNGSAARRLETPAPPHLASLDYKDGEAPKRAAAPEAGPEARQAVLTFQVQGRVDVPAREEQRFRVASLDLAPTFRYLALPRVTPDVFLQALVSPPPGFPLMPGSPLHLMQGQERLGSLTLEAPVPGEALVLSFGAVPGLSARWIVRARGVKEVGEKAREREWVIQEQFTLDNALPTEAQVEVQDRRATSGTESVQVDDEEGTTPDWKEPQPGLRTWLLRVAPGGHGVLDLHTRIRGPLVGSLIQTGDLSLEGVK